MMYGYMTLDDGTEIVHSDMKTDGTVKVYVEKPIHMGFKNATCYLPTYRWEDIDGFTDEEITDFTNLLKDNAHLIIQFSKEGGFINAASF